MEKDKFGENLSRLKELAEKSFRASTREDTHAIREAGRKLLVSLIQNNGLTEEQLAKLGHVAFNTAAELPEYISVSRPNNGEELEERFLLNLTGMLVQIGRPKTE